MISEIKKKTNIYQYMKRKLSKSPRKIKKAEIENRGKNRH